MFSSARKPTFAFQMAGCGYVCPQCEGKGFTDDGEVCAWCTVAAQTESEENNSPASN